MIVSSGEVPWTGSQHRSHPARSLEGLEPIPSLGLQTTADYEMLIVRQEGGQQDFEL